MASIYVFVYFGGEWDDCNVYSGYSVGGVLIPQCCTCSDIISLISKEIGKGHDTHQYKLQYQEMEKGPRIRISNDASLSFYLGLKMGKSDKRTFPLCVDVSPLPKLSECFDALRACGQEPAYIMSPVICLQSSAETGELIDDLMQSNQTIEEMGMELSEYVSFPTGNNVESSIVIITQPNANDVAVGSIFKDKDLLVTSVSLFAIKYRFQFKVLKSDQVSYSVKCLEKCCSWTFRASRTGKVGNFKIRRMAESHNCQNDNVLGSHRQESTLVIANCIKFRFQNAKRIYTPIDIIEDMRETYGVTVSYDKAWRSRERAIRMIRGDPDDSYGTLPSYMYMIEVVNPGSFTRIETDDNDRFLFSFVTLGASIAGWKHCKPVIVVDGTFLKSRYGGTLFTSCTQDANNNIFILAFGVGDAENNNAWEWFFMRLREAFGDRDGLCIVSDHHRSIGHAAEMNLKKEIGKKGKGMSVPFNVAARAYTIAEFKTHMRSLDAIDDGIRGYLEEVGFERWSRAHMTTDRYSTMTSNIVESVNSAIKHAKKYPIEALFECLRCTVQKWFFRNLSDAKATFTRLETRHNSMLNKRVNLAMRLRVYPSSDIVYQVNDGTSTYVVNMDDMTCSCRRFQIDHLPCPHAVAVISTRNYSLVDYCSKYFSKEEYIEAYKGTIYPLGNKEEWQVPEEVRQRLVLPPLKKRGPGRPRENRIKSSMECKKASRCGRCDSYGHNSRTCRNPAIVRYKTNKKRKRYPKETNGVLKRPAINVSTGNNK